MGTVRLRTVTDRLDLRLRGNSRVVVESGQIDYLVVGAVERRSDQRIHTSRDADVAHFTLALRLRNLGYQHARSRDQESTRLEP